MSSHVVVLQPPSEPQRVLLLKFANFRTAKTFLVNVFLVEWRLIVSSCYAAIEPSSSTLNKFCETQESSVILRSH